MWLRASFTVQGSRVGGRGTRRFQSAAPSRLTTRSSRANSRRVRAMTSGRVCRMSALRPIALLALGMDQDLRVALGGAELFEGLGHAADAHVAGDQRHRRDGAIRDVM